jgi:peptidoglycan/LPS O-acetylase OafA/YrhL
LSDIAIASSGAAPAAAAAPTRTFLPYLEGMRGFFGLYVALSHMWFRVTELRPDMLPVVPFFNHFAAFGHNSIGMFIVISGYVLGLPVAKHGQIFRGGVALFARRRALRILPAYFAALAIAIPISLFVLPVFADGLAPKTFALSVALHLAMLHNFSNKLIDTIDSPMWSIAVECDIYVLFPLLLVPLVRRFGFIPMVVSAFALGLIPTLFGALRHEYQYYVLSESCFWYIGLFALGYAAANMSVDRNPAVARRLATWPWPGLTLFFVVLVILNVARAEPFDTSHGARWLPDIFLGLAIACQFCADAQARVHGRTTRFERFFLWRPLLFLGTFSYSFYLIHLPILDLVASFARPTMSDPQIVALCGAGVAVALVVAYGFYLAVERPFMTQYRRQGDAESLRSTAVREIPDAPLAARGPATGD